MDSSQTFSYVLKISEAVMSVTQ